MFTTLRESLGNNIEIGKEMIYLTREECMSSALQAEELIELMEKTLGYHAEGKVQLPAKIGIHPKENTFLHAMPAFIEENNYCGIKWISGFPENRAQFGLQQTVGLSILNDYETGYPMVILDATWITTERTAAVSMVGIKHLANNDAETVGIIGCGAVGRKHVELIETVLPKLKTIYIIDNYEPAMNQLIADYQPKLNAEIIKAESFEQLAKESEVIASATAFIKGAKAKILDEWISDGQTIILCDGHTLYEEKTMNRSDKYILDCLKHHKQFQNEGHYPSGIPNLYSELGEIVIGKKKGRENDKELIINNNIGLAIEDIMLSSAISQNAIKSGKGRKLLF